MALAQLGSLALLVTFVVQVVSDLPPRVPEAVRSETIAKATQSLVDMSESDPNYNVGTLRPETFEFLAQTADGVVAYAFLTSTDSLGIGVRAGDGGASSITRPGMQTAWISAMVSSDLPTSNYELSVRRSGSGNGFEHTFSAQ